VQETDIINRHGNLQATLTRELYDDVTTFGRSLSSGPLLQHRPVVQPFLERIQNKIRTVYEAITCTRRTDVVQHQQEQPRHSMHRHQLRPRLAHEPTTRPPVLTNLAVLRGTRSTMVPRRASCFLHSHSSTVPRPVSCLSQSRRHSQQVCVFIFIVFNIN